ncbi:SsgA family sporulation/cell division regulator [Streptomyces sp. KR55]|uniref:SsgA family sporulation/cell division regulator n=1 Tax=Streptomyces sp. KR55 TaxID=3457425 RepID=UPI003FCF5947
MTENQPAPRAPGPKPNEIAPLSLRIFRIVWDSYRIPLRVEFRFDRGDPLVVSVTFHPEGGPPITWRIGRDLLHDGLLAPTGIGDVRVWPRISRGRPMLRLRLERCGMRVLFELDLHRVEDWLFETYDLVPPGEELTGLDWDGLVADPLEDH